MRLFRKPLVALLFGGALSAAASAPAPSPAPAQDPTSVRGTVLETLEASSYTYLKLKTPSGEVWAAVPKASVAKGSDVTIVGISRMDGFESKTLGRTFDRIWFGALGGDAAAMSKSHAGVGEAPPDASIKVEKAAGPDGRTVSEIWAQRAALKGKTVAVHGKVVKFSADIMGRNWIHLRDGSGSAATRDFDLTVTTDATAKVGDVVTLSGAVAVDRDFGAGYSYPVLLEGARLAK